jgi:hypothetical protein
VEGDALDEARQDFPTGPVIVSACSILDDHQREAMSRDALDRYRDTAPFAHNFGPASRLDRSHPAA